MENEVQVKYQLGSKYFNRILAKFYDNPSHLESHSSEDLKQIFNLFLNSEESKRFEGRYERVNTLFNLLDEWYNDTLLSSKEIIKAGDFIDFCKSRQITFSSTEINFLFSQILGGSSMSKDSDARINQNQFLRNFMKSIFKIALENIMNFIKDQNSLKEFLPITLQVSNFQRKLLLREFKKLQERDTTVPNNDARVNKKQETILGIASNT